MAVKSLTLKITDISDIALFSQMAKKVEGDIIVKKGKFAVDGKSIMGLFSIDLSDGFTVEYPDNEEFENFLNQYKVG